MVCTRSGASRTATKSERVRTRPDCAGTSSTTAALSHTRPELPNSTNSSAINDESRSGLARTSGLRQLCSSSNISSRESDAEDIAHAAQRIELQRPATALTRPDPTDQVCCQTATKVNWIKLLLVRCNGWLYGGSALEGGRSHWDPRSDSQLSVETTRTQNESPVVRRLARQRWRRGSPR